MNAPSGARRVTVGADRLSKWVDGFADRHGAFEVDSSPVGKSPAEVTLRAADGATAWITVPFPPLAVEGSRVITSLMVHVKKQRRIGVLLVRRGGFAAGVFDGSKLVSSKVDTAYVQGGTKAGGWSQQRFARRRDNQAKAAFGEAADIAVRILMPEAKNLDALICGGDRAAVTSVLADPRLSALGDLVAEPWLAVPDPRLRVLEQTPKQFLAVTIALDP